MNTNSSWCLFAVSALFMGTFQLVARLVSYIFLFHEGVLLMSSVLLGGGLFVIGFHTLGTRAQTSIEKMLMPTVTAFFFSYLIVYFKTDDFLMHFLVLTLLFGTFFLAITQYIHISANHFMSIELLGSFVGAGSVVVLSTILLEEWMIIIITTVLVFFVLYETVQRKYTALVLIILLIPYTVIVLLLSSNNLATLATCSGYKSFCIDDAGGQEPTESIPNVKGRSDIYLRDTEYPKQLTVRNTGVHAGTTQHEEAFQTFAYAYFDTEIPKLDYNPKSRIITMGASSGANVVSFLKYVPEADVKAVEIDRAIEKLYASEEYVPYLPKRDSFSFLYGDARTTITTSDEAYDVIGVIVESVNSDLDEYVDESTSLIYTTEALQTYLAHLTPGGYLILQQYAAAGDAGDAMTNKLLASLDLALSDDMSLEENIILYTNAFTTAPDAQRFAIVVYRDGGFSEEDHTTFHEWLHAMQHFTYRGVPNPFNVTLLHDPFYGVVYEQYFDTETHNALTAQFNTDPVTDNTPFRHLITPRPFPDGYYAFYLIGAAILIGLLQFLRQRGHRVVAPYILASFFLGIATFGLQYTLFYKTAAFINTNLIFFAVFLLLPLFFGSIGGYFSTQLRSQTVYMIAVTIAVIGGALLYFDVFTLIPSIVFLMIALLFFGSGMLFPLLLARSSDPRERSMLYGVNMTAGGFASIIMVTLHATVGWNILFLMLLCVIIGAFVIFSNGKKSLV